MIDSFSDSPVNNLGHWWGNGEQPFNSCKLKIGMFEPGIQT
jgi:hypothetical protein